LGVGRFERGIRSLKVGGLGWKMHNVVGFERGGVLGWVGWDGMGWDWRAGAFKVGWMDGGSTKVGRGLSVMVHEIRYPAVEIILMTAFGFVFCPFSLLQFQVRFTPLAPWRVLLG
jgi:hypothetical protein